MTIKIGFPDIPRRAAKITSTRAWGDSLRRNAFENNISGPRNTLAGTTSTFNGLVRTDYDLGASSASVDHLVVGRADLLKNDDVRSIRLRGSRQSAFLPTSISGLRLWLDATRGVTTVSGGVSQWDDLSGNGNHATQGTAGNRPILSRYDNKENLVLSSEDITSNWTATLSTINTATTFTITATNGRLAQDVPTVVGVQYSISARIRAVSGNTNINFRHVGAGTSLTAITITGTLATYSATITANATSINFGIQDTNASGFGQIEITEISFRRLIGPDADYIRSTTSRNIAGTNSNRAIVFDAVNDNFQSSLACNPTGGFFGAISLRANIAGASNQTLIAAYNSDTSSNRRFLVALNSDGVSGRIALLIFRDNTANFIGRHTGSGSFTSGESFVLSFTYDGGTTNSSIKIYKNGTQIDTTNNGAGTYTVPSAGTTIELGSLRLGTSGYLNGNINEAIYSQGSAISDPDRQAVEQYLADKWTLSPTVANHTISSATLPYNDLVLEPVSASSAYRHWWLEMESDAASRFAHSKVYFGTWLDMGECIEDLQVIRQSNLSELEHQDSAGVKLSIGKQNKYQINITWRGVSDALVKSFAENVSAQSKLNNSFYLYAGGNSDQLNGNSLLYCKLISWSFPEKTEANYNTITATFEEL